MGDPLKEGAVPRARLADPPPAARRAREGAARSRQPPRDRPSRVRRRHDRVRHPHPDVPLPHHLAPGRRDHRMPRAPAQRGDAVSVTTAADGIKEIGTPLSDGDVESLRAGDRVRITGVLYTARDAAHGRLLPLIEKGEKLPFDPYEDLGTEAIRRLEVEGFPAIVINDCHGGDLYQDGVKAYAREGA